MSTRVARWWCVAGLMLLPQVVTAQAPRVAATNRPLRIAVFHAAAVLDSMPERAAVESDFALEQAKARTMLTAATDSLRAAVEEFARVEANLTPRQREATTMHLRARELLVEEMVANLDAVIGQRREELQHPLRTRLRDAVRALRLRDGYDLVLDVSGDAVFIDADARIDVTSALVRLLRETPPAKRVPAGR